MRLARGRERSEGVVPLSRDVERIHALEAKGVEPPAVAASARELDAPVDVVEGRIVPVLLDHHEGEVEVRAKSGAGRVVLERDRQGAFEQRARLVRAPVGEEKRLSDERVRDDVVLPEPLGDLQRELDASEGTLDIAGEELLASELGRQHGDVCVGLFA